MKKYLIYSLIFLLICVIAVSMIIKMDLFSDKSVNDSEISEEPEQVEDIQTPDVPKEKRADTKPVEAETVPEEEPQEPYTSPIDFETLQAGNPDIYAWLSITDTEVSFPIVQNEDDTYYLYHNVDGEPANYGAIFTESAYNDKSFDESLTLVYGHRMYSGEMFGSLQLIYSSEQALRDYSELIIYMPEKELHYQIFAAVPYDNRHIMYNYSDGTARGLMSFLYSVSTIKSLDAYVDNENFAQSDDKLVVLSTCLYGDKNKRFLVVAKQV